MKGQAIYMTKKFNPKPFLFLTLTIFSAMIFSLCFQDTINYDEFFSMEWCRLGWKEVIQTLVADVHPPLYYFLLKIITDLTGGSLVAARIFSAVAGMVLLWGGSLFLERNFGIKTAFFYSFFLYLNTFGIQKTTEVRMYMLASVFTVLSGMMSYYILKEEENKKRWVCFTLFSLLAAYTHYYALLTMVFLYGGLILYFLFTHNKKNIIRWLLCSAATIVGYLPWLPVAWKQTMTVNGNYWITFPSSRLAPIRELFDGEVPYTEHIFPAIIILLMAVAVFNFLKSRNIECYWTLMCGSALWGILIFSIWYASRFRPILVSRYLIMPMCLAVLGISGMAKFQNKYAVMLVCLLCAFSGGICYRNAFRTQLNRNTSKTVEFISKRITPDDVILYMRDDYGFFGNCVEYYFPDIENMAIDVQQMQLLGQEEFGEAGTVWIFDNEHYLQDTPQINGLDIEKCGTFGFSTLEFDIYFILR